MGEYADVRQAWADRLAPVPPGDIAAEAASATRELLTTVGLPTAEVYALDFVRDRLARPLDHLGHRYLVVAESRDHDPFGIDLADGRVHKIFDGRRQFVRFVNSGLPQFLVVLGAWSLETWPSMTAPLSADDHVAALRKFEEFVEDRDPAALAGGTYWRQVLNGWWDGVES
jgi:hypothetical protein